MTRAGFDKELHKQVLTKILLDIFKVLPKKLAFKGGTCAYLFYDLPRISLDLDFDILKPLTKEDVDALKLILEKQGSLKEFYEKRFTTFFLLDYQRNAPNIKIELNKRIWQNNNYQNIWFLGVEMKIVDKPTLLTNKMVVLTNRRQAVTRDLFDVYYFLKLGFIPNEELIKERTGKDLENYLKFLIDFIQNNYNKKNILQGLGEVLDEKQKLWAKRDLIQETIKSIKTLTKQNGKNN